MHAAEDVGCNLDVTLGTSCNYIGQTTLDRLHEEKRENLRRREKKQQAESGGNGSDDFSLAAFIDDDILYNVRTNRLPALL